MVDAPVRVAVANDFEIIVAGLCTMLTPFTDRVRVVDLSTDGVPPDIDRRVDVLLFDTFGRAELGLQDLRGLTQAPNIARTAVYTWETRPAQVEQALQAGISGWLSKALTGEALVDALVRVHCGERVVVTGAHGRHAPESASAWPGRDQGLTPRESEVLALLLTGARNRDIARDLFLSSETVKFHLTNIFRKLGVRTRAEAVAKVLSTSMYRRSRPEPAPSSPPVDRARA